MIDGLESFAFSQYYPLHLHLAVGADSHFVYAFSDSELRRKGRMTPSQKRRRQQEEQRVGRPDPKDVEKGVAVLLELVAPPGSCPSRGGATTTGESLPGASPMRSDTR